MFARKIKGGIIDWDGSYTRVYYHSGKTDSNFGHHDYQNASGLGLYHWHHGEGPHLHPHITEGKSLIDLFKSYNGSVCTTVKSSSGAFTYMFEGIIELEQDKRYFTLEITGLNDSFYLVGDKNKEAVESFWGTELNPVYVKRDDSPWSGAVGGFDILVNADYFKALVKKYCGLEESEDNAWLSNLENDTSLGLTSTKKKAMIAAASVLIEQNFELAFIAGVLGNIKNEGTIGMFESSAYTSNPSAEPDYLQYMDNNYNYREEYSGQNITGKSLSVVYNMLLQLEPNSWRDPKHRQSQRVWFGVRAVDI